VECPSCPENIIEVEPWQRAVLAPYVEELSNGLQPYGEKGFGVCEGRDRSCDNFLGSKAPELEPGEYVVRAEVAVPALGENWKVQFKIACETTRANGKVTPYSHERMYDIKHIARDDRGYRLHPLWTIQSPHKQGARSCTYELVPYRPDGSTGSTWTGSYTTPAP
jgi:hypothetical protein